MQTGAFACLAAVTFGLTWAATAHVQGVVDPLPGWNDGRATRAIIAFVTAATDESNIGFIPVAERLGNTPSIARKSYVHPAVVDAFLDGTLHEGMSAAAGTDIDSLRLRREERAVLALLLTRLAAEAEKVRKTA
jgi:DNA topoisomerase IB